MHFFLIIWNAILIILLKISVITIINTHRLYTRHAGMYDNLYNSTLTSLSILFVQASILHHVTILNRTFFT